MLIRKKKPFAIGACLLLSFLFLFALILIPLIPGGDGDKINGLQYADKIFNRLAKGSSWFIPQVRASIGEHGDKNVSLTIKSPKPSTIPMAIELLRAAGAENVSANGDQLSFSGNLSAILNSAVNDAELLYNNNGTAIFTKYNGAEPLAVAAAWWNLLEPCIKVLQAQHLVQQATLVDAVIRRAIEPGNNFYGLLAWKVSENIPLICAFMLFYVVYTIWYGFAIYELFNGLGLMGAQEHGA